MNYADLHVHLLCNVDDGAQDETQMQEILDAAYADGTRALCATPHFHPGFYGNNHSASLAAFEKLKIYAKKYPDLKLFFGNELYYSPNCLQWLKNGECCTINDSHYLLVDFSSNEKADIIVASLRNILNCGYQPILAHAERYTSFQSDLREVHQLQHYGVLIQMDAQSPLGGLGFGAKKRSRKLLEHYFVDLVASDAHNIKDRPPKMHECCDYVVQKCGREYAQQLFVDNPLKILNDIDIRKETD